MCFVLAYCSTLPNVIKSIMCADMPGRAKPMQVLLSHRSASRKPVRWTLGHKTVNYSHSQIVDILVTPVVVIKGTSFACHLGHQYISGCPFGPAKYILRLDADQYAQ